MTNETSQPTAYELFMLALCLYVMAALGAEIFCSLSDSTKLILHVVDTAICVIFFADFLVIVDGDDTYYAEDVRALLNAGADKVSVNTAAVRTPELVNAAAARYGSQCIVAAIDAKQSAPEAWEVYTHGGRTPTGLDAVDWAREVVARGAGEILLTSMDRDGTKDGYDIPLTRSVVDSVSIPVIASGGVGTLEHLYDGFTKAGASACLAASIFHYREHTIGEAKEYLQKRGVAVRL